MHETMIEVERHDAAAVVRLTRPRQLNALCDGLIAQLHAAMHALDADPGCGAIVLTGSERAFAAGADIAEMAARRYPDVLTRDWLAAWEAALRVDTPTIAAVAGYALGGGCEIAMMCDMILAADTARFAQPEITLGVIPGAGGTQRLTRLVGRALAMDMVLTGRQLNAEEARQAGLVSRVFAADRLLDEAVALAAAIAARSRPAVLLAKRAVHRAEEMSMAEGCRAERAAFLSLFGSADQTEGMAAFLDKRAPVFRR